MKPMRLAFEAAVPLNDPYPNALLSTSVAAVLIVAAFTAGAGQSLFEVIHSTTRPFIAAPTGTLAEPVPETYHITSIPTAESVMLDQLTLDAATVQLDETGSAPTLLVSCGGCNSVTHSRK